MEEYTPINKFITSGLANYCLTHKLKENPRNHKLPEKFRSYIVPEEFQDEYGSEYIRITEFERQMKIYTKNN